MNSIIAFTDGASKGNPGPGGWGCVVVDGDHIIEQGGHEDNTTNNRMEMLAVLSALQYAKEKKKGVTIYTDSRYVMSGATQWLGGWQVKGWKTSTGGAVLNQDIWKKMAPILSSVTVIWKLLPGHAGVPGNERADVIASSFASGDDIVLFKGTMGDYGVNIMDFSSHVETLEKKNEKKKHSQAKAYSYLSMVNGVIEKHSTWKECEARVKGVKGVSFRKSLSSQDEQNIINEWKSKKR